MRIKKYIANSLQEGKIRILNELGDEAVILSSRSVKNPSDQSKELVEIVAAIDDSPVTKNKQKSILPAKQQYIDKEPGDMTEEESSNQGFLNAAGQIISEINSLKDIVNNLAENIKYKLSWQWGPILELLYKELRKLDYSDSFALQVLGNISKERKIENYKAAVKLARKYIANQISVTNPLQQISKQKLAAFIGPSGCGKTSSLIKVAIICKLLFDSNILIISCDTQKIGTVEQLQAYCSIAGITFRSVNSPKELQIAIGEEKYRDYIFIDTPGTNQKDSKGLENLNELLEPINWDFVYLVVSSTTNAATFKQIVEQFSTSKPNSLILTKIDEAVNITTIIEAIINSKIPIAYITNGQQVPDNIEPASSELIQNIVFPKTGSE